jgi:syntaxin-binding protein 5
MRDTLLNPSLIIPPRPTISNLQWISGTQFVTPEDMDLLIGGPDRPPSKRMLAQARADEESRRRDARTQGRPGASSSGQPAPSDETWGAWATRNLNERTEKLNLVGDSMDNLSSNSKGWADDVNKYMSKQKRGFVMGAVKSKFGF